MGMMNEMLMCYVVQDMKIRAPRKRSKPARLSDSVASAPKRRLTSAPKKARKSAAVEKATRCSQKSMTPEAWAAHKDRLREDKNARRRENRASSKGGKGVPAPGPTSTKKKSKAALASAKKKSKAALEEEEEEEEVKWLDPTSKTVIAQLTDMIDPDEAKEMGKIGGPLYVMEACAPSTTGVPSFILRTVRLSELITLCREGRLVNARPIP